MSAVEIAFEALRLGFQKAIAAWPSLPVAEWSNAEQTYNDFNNTLTLAALRPIKDQNQLQILHEGVEHLLKYEGDDLPKGFENAIAAVISGAIEEAECPLYAALLAIVRHRAQQTGRSF